MTEATPASNSDEGQQTQTVTTDQNGNGQVHSDQGQGSQAGSPSAAAEPKTMLDAVNAALVKPSEGASQAPNGPAGQPQEGKQPGGKNGSEEYDGSADLSDEERGKLSERTQRRMAHLAGEVKAKSSEIETLKPDADVGRSIMDFAHRAGLSADELNQGFDVMYAIKKDPVRALQMLEPLVDQLRSVAGEVLSPELQQAVNEGRIDEAMARELSRNKARSALSQQQLQQREDERKAETQRSQNQSHVNAISDSARQYDLQWQKTDPDYALKKDRVLELVELRIRRDGYPKSTAEMQTYIQESRDKVEKELASLRPAGVRPITPITGGGSSAQGKPAPKNMLDVINSTLG